MPTWSPDGMRIAAFFDGGLAILDATTHQEMDHVGLPKRDAPPQDIVWSPDGTIPSGAFPREISLSADGQALFLTNARSSSIQVIDMARLPVEPKRKL